ncbi:MAG: nucleotidyl transferase AbiEii/AbiGii toxin family protein [Planctomycetaceae bacterium]
MNLKEDLLALTRALNASEIDYAVCGGLAMAIHGFVRATKDIDILIRREDLQRVEALAEAAGFVIPAGIIPFGTGTSDAREIFRISKVIDNVVVPLDLMFVAPSLESVWQDRVIADFDGEEVCVVSKEGLAAMKRTAGRPQDLLDIKYLESGNDELPS